MRKTISCALVAAILLSGCYGSVKTQKFVLDAQTPQNLVIGMAETSIDTAEASDIQSATSGFGPLYTNYKRDLYANLLSESHGLIGAVNDQPLRLFVKFRFNPVYGGRKTSEMLLFATSLIILPLSIPLTFVPNSDTQEYSVNYIIKDLDNNVLFQQGFTDKIEGSYGGWFFLRDSGRARFLKKAAAFASKNAALHIIKSIKENTPKIASAAKQVGGLSARVVENAAGTIIKSDIDELPVSRLPGRKNAYAIVIGIEQYRQKLPKADFAVHDAQTVTKYLTNVLGYPEKNVITLVNEQAGRGNFVKYFEKWLVDNVEKESSVFVYYSGHGAPDPETNSAYLVPFDGDPSLLDQTGYSLERMYNALGALPAKDVVVALDSCFSGAGGRSVLAKGARPMVMNLQSADIPTKNISILSAASGDQMSSTYDDKGHGLFTYYMLKGIKHEDVTRPDGSLRIDDLFSYLKPQVERIARKQYNNEQTPQLIEAKK